MTTSNQYFIEPLSFQYAQSPLLFKDFTLPLCKNQWLGILGPSGVGKSTLLHALAKQLQTKLPELRIAVLPQLSTLLPWLSILNNVLVGDLLRSTKTSTGQTKALSLLQEMGLAKHSYCLPKQLSGGQCQRAIIARTIYEESDIILMDEPFVSLDAITKQEIQTCAQKYFTSKTVVLVTHDPLEALRLCHRLIVLKGRPVHYDNILNLHSPMPRKLDDPELNTHYSRLMEKLRLAKQQMHEQV